MSGGLLPDQLPSTHRDAEDVVVAAVEFGAERGLDDLYLSILPRHRTTQPPQCRGHGQSDEVSALVEELQRGVDGDDDITVDRDRETELLRLPGETFLRQLPRGQIRRNLDVDPAAPP